MKILNKILSILILSLNLINFSIAMNTEKSDEESLSLTGKIVTQNDFEYTKACLMCNNIKTIENIHPSHIVFCYNIDDIVNAVKWAHKNNIQISVRSGGHNYEGFSLCDGIVVDLSLMNQIKISENLDLVKVDAGCKIMDIYSELWKHDRTIIGGSCGTVGISGFCLGGGFGFLSRKYGLAIDRLKEIEIVTYDGTILIANETTNSDLFWSCRGAGGGNFGIISSLTFETIPIDQVIFYKILWPWEDAAEIINAWQDWAPNAPIELTSILRISLKEFGNIASVGIFLGDKSDLFQLLNEKLICFGHPNKIIIQSMSWIDAANALEAGPWNNKAAFKAKSDYIRKPFTKEAIDTIIKFLSVKHHDIKNAMIIFDSYGGIINQIPEDKTAFIHRNELFSMQYLAYWDKEDETAPRTNREWLNSFYQEMRPYASGYAYQNYVDSDLENWIKAYYGTNEQKLRTIKTLYDPTNFFRFSQSIPCSD